MIKERCSQKRALDTVDHRVSVGTRREVGLKPGAEAHCVDNEVRNRKARVGVRKHHDSVGAMPAQLLRRLVSSSDASSTRS